MITKIDDKKKSSCHRELCKPQELLVGGADKVRSNPEGRLRSISTLPKVGIRTTRISEKILKNCTVGGISCLEKFYVEQNLEGSEDDIIEGQP